MATADTIQNCSLRRGRGNRENAFVIAGEGRNSDPEANPKSSRLIKSATIADNRIYGGTSIKGVETLQMRNNQRFETTDPDGQRVNSTSER